MDIIVVTGYCCLRQ